MSKVVSVVAIICIIPEASTFFSCCIFSETRKGKTKCRGKREKENWENFSSSWRKREKENWKGGKRSSEESTAATTERGLGESSWGASHSSWTSWKKGTNRQWQTGLQSLNCIISMLMSQSKQQNVAIVLTIAHVIHATCIAKWTLQ